MRRRQLFLYAVILVFLVIAIDCSNALPFAIQTTPTSRDIENHRSSYVAGLMYDWETDRIYITGTTYGNSFFEHVDDSTTTAAPSYAEASSDSLMSDCFLGILQIPRVSGLATDGEEEKPSWVRRVAIGVPDQSEYCSSIYTQRQGNRRKLYLAGHSIAGPSVLVHQQPWYDPSERNNTSVYGLVLDLTWFAEVQGGYLMHKNTTQFPVDIAGVYGSTGESLLSTSTVPENMAVDDIFVASLVSDTANMNPAYLLYRDSLTDQTMANEQPDMMVAGGYLPPAFGDRFALVVQRIGQRTLSAQDLMTATRNNDVSTIQQVMNNNNDTDAEPYGQYGFVKEPFVQRWQREFSASNGRSILVSASMHKILRNRSQVLFLVGSTRGSSSALAGDVSHDDDSVNGFVVQIDANVGILRRTKSIASVNRGMDRALGICQKMNVGKVDSADPFLYVVGITDATLTESSNPLSGSFQAFLMKLSADTLTVVWTKQLAAAKFDGNDQQRIKPGSMHGMSCAVTPDGLHVFIAGIVKDGASIFLDGKNNVTSSHGRDDIFVAQFQASDGSMNYVRQIGTSRDDHMAAGEGLVCDKYGNAILLGNTRGSLMHPDKENDMASDIIILSVDRLSGEHYGFVDPVQMNTNSTVPSKDETHFPFKFDHFDRTTACLLGGAAVAVILIFAFLVCFLRRRRLARLEKRIVKTYLQAAANDSVSEGGKFLDLEQPLKMDEVYLDDQQSETSSDMTSLLDPVLESNGESVLFSYNEELHRLQMIQSMQDDVNNNLDEIVTSSDDETDVRIFEDDVVDFEASSPLFLGSPDATSTNGGKNSLDPLLG